MSIDIERFAVIKLPYISPCFRDYVRNFSNGRCLQPITVIKVSKLKNMNVQLYDLKTEKLIGNITDAKDTWLVIDGKKRLKSLMMLYQQTEDNNYATIDAIVEDMDNISDGNIIKYMTDINFMSSSWTAKDYVDYCCMINPSDEIFQMSHLLMSLGAPISTVSRLASGTSNCFSPKALALYVNGSELAMFCVD